MATNFPTGVDTFTNPVSNDSLNSPSHSVQHANANDSIEAIESYILNGTGAEWKTYAPTLSGGWSNGNGVYIAQYSQIGKTVHVSLQFTLGTLTTKGASMSFSLPVEAKRITPNPFANIFLVAGGTSSIGICSFEATTSVRIYSFNVAGTYGSFSNITASVPATWVTGDYIRFALTYECV
jgi:hypothetical protein